MTTLEFEAECVANRGQMVNAARKRLAQRPIVRSTVDAEDVVQHVMAKMVGRYASMPREEFLRYAMTAIKNRIHDLVSRRIEVEIPAERDMTSALQGPETGPELTIERRELKNTIQEVINTFSIPEARDYLTLVFLKEWSASEAAAATGHHSGKQTTFHFRERMAKALGRIKD